MGKTKVSWESAFSGREIHGVRAKVPYTWSLAERSKTLVACDVTVDPDPWPLRADSKKAKSTISEMRTDKDGLDKP